MCYYNNLHIVHQSTHYRTIFTNEHTHTTINFPSINRATNPKQTMADETRDEFPRERLDKFFSRKILYLCEDNEVLRRT